MKAKKYFHGIKSMIELKRQWKQLSKLHHPDNGGDPEIMKEINAQRDKQARMILKKENNSSNETDVQLGGFWVDKMELNDLGSAALADQHGMFNFAKTISDNLANDLAENPEAITDENGNISFAKVFTEVTKKLFSSARKNEIDTSDSPKDILGKE